MARSLGSMFTTVSKASRVTFSSAFSSIEWVASCAFDTNCSGVCQVPTIWYPCGICWLFVSSCSFITPSSGISPLEKEGSTFWKGVKVWVAGRRWMVQNSGMSWSRFLCCRCCAARVWMRGNGLGAKTRPWASKRFWPMRLIFWLGHWGRQLRWPCPMPTARQACSLERASVPGHFDRPLTVCRKRLETTSIECPSSSGHHDNSYGKRHPEENPKILWAVGHWFRGWWPKWPRKTMICADFLNWSWTHVAWPRIEFELRICTTDLLWPIWCLK